MTFNEIKTATHTWHGAADGKMKPCFKCKKLTSGRIKDVRASKVKPLCSSCALMKGFKIG